MEKQIIGRAERIDFLDLDMLKVPAKVDTGADASSIWASSITETADGGIKCVFLGPDFEQYTGNAVLFDKEQYSVTRVANSFGHKEVRYKVKLRVKIGKRLINASFTLADRGSKTYPVLIGRRLLQGKFVVDVSAGMPLTEIEKTKKQKLQQELKQMGYSSK